jgi:hypothetical protein
MLQSKAGYIDARPHIRQLEEVLLQRTAGPYIWVRLGHSAMSTQCPLYPPTCGPRTDIKVLYCFHPNN